MFVVAIPCIYIALLFYSLRDWRAPLAWLLLWATGNVARYLSFYATKGIMLDRTSNKARESSISQDSREFQSVIADEVWRPEPRRTINLLLRGMFSGIIFFQGWSISATYTSRIIVFAIVFILHAFNFSDAFRSLLGLKVLVGNPDAELQRWTFMNFYGSFKRRLLVVPIGILIGALISPFFSFLNIIIER